LSHKTTKDIIQEKGLSIMKKFLTLLPMLLCLSFHSFADKKADVMGHCKGRLANCLKQCDKEDHKCMWTCHETFRSCYKDDNGNHLCPDLSGCLDDCKDADDKGNKGTCAKACVDACN
jgi:hypothetical protein